MMHFTLGPSDQYKQTSKYALNESHTGLMPLCIVVSEAAIKEVEQGREAGQGAPEVLAAIKREGHHRSVSDLEKKDDPPAPGDRAGFSEKMAHRVATKEGRAKYKHRQQTIHSNQFFQHVTHPHADCDPQTDPSLGSELSDHARQSTLHMGVRPIPQSPLRAHSVKSHK